MLRLPTPQLTPMNRAVGEIPRIPRGSMVPLAVCLGGTSGVCPGFAVNRPAGSRTGVTCHLTIWCVIGFGNSPLPCVAGRAGLRRGRHRGPALPGRPESSVSSLQLHFASSMAATFRRGWPQVSRPAPDLLTSQRGGSREDPSFRASALEVRKWCAIRVQQFEDEKEGR